MIFTVSAKVSRDIKKRYGKDSQVLYPALIETKGSLERLPKKVLALRNKSKLLLLQVGNLHSQKRQTLSLEALKGLQKVEPTASIIFVGDGPDRRYLESLSEELGLSKRVFFAGFVPQGKIGAYYEVCDLNLLPAVAESFSTTPLEALSHTKISVISGETGVLEIISNFVLTSNINPDDFMRKISSFIKKRELFAMKAREGRTFVVRELTWEKYCMQFFDAVNKLQPREVSAGVYDKKYYRLHYANATEPLLKERKVRLERALKFAKIAPNLNVLDLGCGNGELSVMFAKKGAKVWGVDYSKEAVVLAKERRKKLPARTAKNIHFAQMDAKRLAFDDNFFDQIICLDVFEHIYPRQLRKIILEMKRVVRPRGIIVVETSPNSFYLKPFSLAAKKVLGIKRFESDQYHINVFNYFRFKTTLQSLGGRVDIGLYNDGHQFFSSRLETAKKIPSWIKLIAGMVDFAFENPFSEKIILSTPLKIFLAHDLWGVVHIRKKV